MILKFYHLVLYYICQTKIIIVMMNRKYMVKVADESVEGANIYKSKIGMLYIEDSNGCLRILNPEDSFQGKYYPKYSNIVFESKIG